MEEKLGGYTAFSMDEGAREPDRIKDGVGEEKMQHSTSNPPSQQM